VGVGVPVWIKWEHLLLASEFRRGMFIYMQGNNALHKPSKGKQNDQCNNYT
jgi:hypothetical protein